MEELKSEKVEEEKVYKSRKDIKSNYPKSNNQTDITSLYLSPKGEKNTAPSSRYIED
ncbi:MAG: hypothetical protein JEZ01_05470 [Labilibaculum sp.]|nr:hypothetical protein [Labilibaculum sp.]MBI9057201.1 hypothetical protein [Labilibaculum sp.]